MMATIRELILILCLLDAKHCSKYVKSIISVLEEAYQVEL